MSYANRNEPCLYASMQCVRYNKVNKASFKKRPFSGLKVFETSFWDLIGAKEDCSKFKLDGLLHP